MTLFKQVADNAISTTATNLTVAGVTSLTTATGDGAKFPLPGNGFRLDIWSGTSSDPTSDTNYEQVTVTARSGDVFTHTATTKSHSGTVNIMLPQDAADISDLTTAVNSLENSINNASVVGNEVPVGLVNGSNTAYTTASNMATGSLKVYRNGVRLKGGGVDFTQGSNNAFTMVTAPNTGDLLLVDYNVSATGFSVGTNSSTTNEQPTGTVNGTTTVFTTLRPYIASSLQVYIDGIMQRRGTDYTETTPSTGSFTMATAPLTGQSILADYQFNLNPSSNADTVDGIHASSTATANQLVALNSSAKLPTAANSLGREVHIPIGSIFGNTTSTTYLSDPRANTTIDFSKLNLDQATAAFFTWTGNLATSGTLFMQLYNVTDSVAITSSEATLTVLTADEARSGNILANLPTTAKKMGIQYKSSGPAYAFYYAKLIIQY